jgi:hypothetical protein
MRPIIVPLLAVVLTAAPALAILPASATPPSTHRTPASKPWWEEYDDAMRAVDRANWTAALQHLEEAVRRNSKSSARARTYGMRFIEYFPYYYLGLAHYKLATGRATAATDINPHLAKALEYFSREKNSGAYRAEPSVARQLDFYLVAVTRVIEEYNPPVVASVVILEEKRPASPEPVPVGLPPSNQTAPSKESPPTPAPEPAPPLPAPTTAAPTPAPDIAAEPPDVMITRPRQAAELREETILVHGDVMDKYGITEITLEVNGRVGPLRIQRPGGMQITARRVPGSDQVASLGQILDFSTDVGLELGETTIVVRATNIKGKVVTATRTVRRVKSQ